MSCMTLDVTVERLSWADEALCADPNHVPETWFPDKWDHAGIDAAKEVCAACPAIFDCLAHALEHGEVGVWGGTTTDERAEIIRERRLSARRDREKARRGPNTAASQAVRKRR